MEFTIHRAEVEKSFRDYIAAYNLNDAKVKLKVDHTFRVAALSDVITGSLGMNGYDKDLAWLLGMLHDIGRFEQVRRYGTFVDSVSVDHAEFGADLLFKENLIDSFPTETLSEEWMRRLETAIRLHNKLKLPEDLDDLTRQFCDIIRDADKLDIFRVVSELSFEERAGTSLSMMQQADEANDAVMECVRQHRCVPRNIRKTRFEVHISHCCMAFELVYPESRKIAGSQGFVSRLLLEQNADGKPLWNEKECAQLRIVKKEIEAAWGEPVHGA